MGYIKPYSSEMPVSMIPGIQELEEWGRVRVTDKILFNMTSDSVTTHIWREQGIRNHSFNITERDYFGDDGVLFEVI